MRSIYITATGKNVGKTTLALGLLFELKKRRINCQYFKPVGQHFFEFEGQRADSDAWLCRAATGTEAPAETLSPVIVPSGFVTEYLENPDCEHLRKLILDSAARLLEKADMLVIEGTGHAGVGSCLDLSNAAVARMLDAVAVMVVPGGIGSSLDEVALSTALFNAEGVPIAGVIANKVFLEKYEKVSRALELGLKRRNTRLLGVVPYEPSLTFPTVEQISVELSARVLCGADALHNIVQNTIIAAMTPPNVLRYITEDSLVITPGDRVDNILLAISADKILPPDSHSNIAGIVLTGGLLPHVAVLPLLKSAGIPVLLCREDTFTVASIISQRVFKINPSDTLKIAAAQQFVREYVDLDALIAELEKNGAGS